jgi:hypothetical protein
MLNRLLCILLVGIAKPLHQINKPSADALAVQNLFYLELVFTFDLESRRLAGFRPSIRMLVI